MVVDCDCLLLHDFLQLAYLGLHTLQLVLSTLRSLKLVLLARQMRIVALPGMRGLGNSLR